MILLKLIGINITIAFVVITYLLTNNLHLPEEMQFYYVSRIFNISTRQFSPSSKCCHDNLRMLHRCTLIEKSTEN